MFTKHVILQDTKVIACHANCGLQKDDCNADINLSRKLILPPAKSRALLKKIEPMQKTAIWKVEPKNIQSVILNS